jgi:chromosomal replication initiation ATPase DnaA
VLIRKQDRIDYILKGVCDFYGVSLDTLNKPTRSTKKVIPRYMAMHLLYDIADCTLKDVTYALGYRNSVSSVSMHLQEIRDAIDPKSYGDMTIKAEYRELLRYLKL